MDFSTLSDNELIAEHGRLDDELFDLAVKSLKLDNSIKALDRKRGAIQVELRRPSVWAKDDEYKAINASKETLKARNALVVTDAFNVEQMVIAIRIIAEARNLELTKG